MKETVTRGGWPRAIAIALALATAAGCSSSEAPPQSRPGHEPYYVDEATELSIGEIPGLASWHRDVVLTCPVGPLATSLHGGSERFAGCQVKLVEAGSVRAIGISGVRAARRLSGDRLLLQKPNLDLVVRSPSGEESVIASAALTPTVAPEGERIAFVQYPEGTTEPGLGVPTRLVMHDIATGERRVITEDPSAYAPYIVPGTGDVLFVSARTGLASLWLAPEGKPEVQLTNVGLTRMGKGFVPVPLDQLIWLPGSRQAVYTAHYGDDVLWKIDVDTGEAEVLGPGRFPNLTEGGRVLAHHFGARGDVARAHTVHRYLEAP
ncbi:TolB family protein [Polyangium aurulentum]|uniref:TolB family protein n=1 Tax=Polyangium aurulentum TaxID=2567896 RepID=UPI00146D750F|nr:hypothetical protein [Polyangium aurulentum]UQA59016.1 hypothetical protein E8A73_000400 [Polyangium aurulentum]